MLSIEDYNTAQLNYTNEYYELDTLNIGTNEFEDVKYDFVNVSHTYDETNGHSFSFTIDNSLWTGNWYIISRENGQEVYIPDDRRTSYSMDTTTVYCKNVGESVILVLYLSSFKPWNFRYNYILYKHTTGDGIWSIPVSKIGNTRDIQFINLSTGEEEYFQVTQSLTPVNVVSQFGVLFLIDKRRLSWSPRGTLKSGVKNTVRLRVSSSRLPGGSYTDENPVDIKILYGDTIIDAVYDETIPDYVFELDLTNKTDNKPVKFTVIFNGSKYLSANREDCELECDYPTAENYEELINLLVNGVGVIELKHNMHITDNIIINNDVYITGGKLNKTLYLENNTIYINNDITLKMDKVNLRNGSPVLKQREGSKVILNNCHFSLCKINDEDKGSVVVNTETSVTELNNCIINESPHSIYNAGNLTITNTRASYTYITGVDPDYSMLVNSYAGEVIIKNSTFKIRIETDSLCSNEIDMRFAQSLIGIGEEAIINGVYGSKLHENNCLPLFDNPYNNSSHIYAKYYYPEIDDCVIINPELSYENQSACHRVIGTDWVYKNNCKLNHANSNNINHLGGD